jgi:NTE family protein
VANIIPILADGGTHLPAHIGVLQALKYLYIDFSHLVGVSGGSMIASFYAAGLSIAE